jgi:hypothetical protein
MSTRGTEENRSAGGGVGGPHRARLRASRDCREVNLVCSGEWDCDEWALLDSNQ